MLLKGVKVSEVTSGDIVVIKSSKEFSGEVNGYLEGMLVPGWEEHYFLVEEVFDDLVSGYSLTGSLKDVYGEPELGLIKKVYREVKEE
jgi:hypothetical protein